MIRMWAFLGKSAAELPDTGQRCCYLQRYSDDDSRLRFDLAKTRGATREATKELLKKSPVRL